MKKIAIIGANEQQNPLILKAHEMGFETHVFAWQNEEIGEKIADFFYPVSVGNKEEILKICRNLEVDAVVSIGSDLAALSAAYVSEAMGLATNAYASVACATNKLITRSIFSKCAIPQPMFAEVGNAIPYEQLEKLGYPLVVKPSDRSGGRGLRKIASKRQLHGAVNEARELSFEKKAIVEQYISGQLYSCECMSFNGIHKILGYTRRRVEESRGKMCETAHFQPANLPLSVKRSMDELSMRILSTLGLRTGAACIEFIVDANREIYVLEVTPSMYGDFIGTHLIPLAQGYDYLKMVIDAACGVQPDMHISGETAQAEVHFLYSEDDLHWLHAANGCSVVKSAIDEMHDLPRHFDGERCGYSILCRPYRQFGGCQPLRVLPDTGVKPFDVPEKNVLALNSEYAALRIALEKTGAKRVYVPHYAPANYSRIVQELGMEALHYRITESFVPMDIPMAENDVLLIVNSHGAGSWIPSYVKEFRNVIIDHSMAFFTAPVMREGIYNIYSCRKFFPVPDGAYLISASISEADGALLERDISYKRARTLLLSLELGENAAYKEQQANEQELAQSCKRMSLLTEKLLSGIDFREERRLRQRNYRILDRYLNRFQLFPLGTGEDAVPQFYPLLVDADIRNILISKKIYVPVMWRRLLEPAFDSSFEQMLAKRLLCLPIAPVYSEEDMEYIAETVEALLN